MYNWAAGKIFGRLIGAKLLKLSTLPFLDVMLPSSKTLIPPYLQTPTRLPGQAYPLGLAWPVRQARLFVRLVGTTSLAG